MWQTRYALAEGPLLGSLKKEDVSTFFSQLWARLNDSSGRLDFAIAIAALGGLIGIFTARDAFSRIASGVSTIGAFWFAWLVSNTFGHPKSSKGSDLSKQALFGHNSGLNSLKDLVTGIDGLWVVVAAVLGLVVIIRMGGRNSGFIRGISAFITGFGTFSGILIVINLFHILK